MIEVIICLALQTDVLTLFDKHYCDAIRHRFLEGVGLDRISFHILNVKKKKERKDYQK